MAAKIEQVFGINVELIPEGKGIFDVSVDGHLEYSKFETGTFPNESELVATLNSKYAGG